MKEPIKDDERLSALFEGRVVGPERDALLAHLAASDDDYEVFADTAEILRALELEDERIANPAQGPTRAGDENEGMVTAAADAPRVPATVAEGEATLAEASGVIPFPGRERRARYGTAWWMKRAAMIVGVALVSTLALRGRAPAGAGPVDLVARLEQPRLPQEWSDNPPWPGERGDGPAAGARARAVRVGVGLVDLAVAARAGDNARTELLARQLIRRSAAGPRASGPLRQIAASPGVPLDSLNALLREATHRLEEGLEDGERGYLRLGAWAEAARLAAYAHDEGFFGAGDVQASLDHAERLTRGDDAASAAVGRVRKAIPAGAPPVWVALETELTRLLKEIAS